MISLTATHLTKRASKSDNSNQVLSLNTLQSCDYFALIASDRIFFVFLFIKRSFLSAYFLVVFLCTDIIFACHFITQVNTKEAVDKRSVRKLKEREREQVSHVKKRKPAIQQLQVV